MTAPLSTGRERRTEQKPLVLVEGYGMAYERNGGTRYSKEERAPGDANQRRRATYRALLDGFYRTLHKGGDQKIDEAVRDLILALRCDVEAAENEMQRQMKELARMVNSDKSGNYEFDARRILDAARGKL